MKKNFFKKSRYSHISNFLLIKSIVGVLNFWFARIRSVYFKPFTKSKFKKSQFTYYIDNFDRHAFK